ncbi:MAG: hypothetical protein AABY16_02735 [Nanoarchaeota archaeon]
MAISLEVLDYAGDDEHGRFCAAVCVRDGNARQYLLYRGRTDDGTQRFVHETADFPDERTVKKAFPGYFVESWKETEGLGHGVTTRAFWEAVDASRESRNRARAQ